MPQRDPGDSSVLVAWEPFEDVNDRGVDASDPNGVVNNQFTQQTSRSKSPEPAQMLDSDSGNKIKPVMGMSATASKPKVGGVDDPLFSKAKDADVTRAPN